MPDVADAAVATDARSGGGGRRPRRGLLPSLGQGGRSWSTWLIRLSGTIGVPLALVLAIVGFGVARPATFLTASNFRDMLFASAAPTILAVGLTVALVMGDFDLSIGSMLGLGGASAVALMSLDHVGWFWAIVVALVLAVATGIVNGTLVAYAGGSSFIITLAMGTILLGVEYLFDGENTVYSGVAHAYTRIGQARPVGGINVQVWIALGVAIVAYLLMERSEAGRYMYAIGGNREAARLAGIAVNRYRLIGFVVAAVAAAFAGILITAQAGASTPNAGVPYLLPAYAAVFLGTAAFQQGQFNVAGTIVGVLFLEVISTGLIMLNLSTAVIDIVQGVILVLAILSTRVGRKTIYRVGR
jgi:ribose transport system permease protein